MRFQGLEFVQLKFRFTAREVEYQQSVFDGDGERIRHILTKQVYGMAPSRIIYLIAVNYIFGFDEDMRVDAIVTGLRDVGRLRPAGQGHEALLRGGPEQDALRRARPDRNRGQKAKHVLFKAT